MIFLTRDARAGVLRVARGFVVPVATEELGDHRHERTVACPVPSRAVPPVPPLVAARRGGVVALPLALA